MSQLTFTLLQSSLAWHDKVENLKNFTTQINAIQVPTNIVVLPEMFSTGFSMNVQALAESMDGETVQWMREIAAEKKIIITGSIIVIEDGKYYNRMIWMQPNGIAHTYDKRHCFSLADEHKHFTAGNKKIIVQANGIKICLQICYDLRFPVFSRQMKNNEYDVLLYVANWPQKREYAWKQLLIARAIENQCFVLGVNITGVDGNNLQYNGFSSIINPIGEVLLQSEKFTIALTHTIHKREIDEIRKSIPFLQDGDDFRLEI
jgi:omega-amidase